MASSMRGDPVDAPVTVEPARSLLTTLAALRRIVEGGVTVGTPIVEETAVEHGEEIEAAPSGRPPAWLRAGIRFDPDDCSSGVVYDPVCTPGSIPVDTIAGGDNEDADVLAARIGVECSVAGDTDGAILRDKARRTMQVCQHGLIGAEFWRGDVVRAEGHPNRFLASDDVSELAGGDPRPALDALADLEESLAGLGSTGCGCGERGMIHASPRTVTIWAALGVLRVENGVLLSPSDHWIVTGPGYDGSGPGTGYEPGDPDETGAAAWAFGTGLLDLRLGPVRLTSDVNPDTNVRRVFADRPFVVSLGGCCHVGVNVDLSDRT